MLPGFIVVLCNVI